MKLEIYVLVDNFASGVCRAEHGLSYLIKYDDSVLFDFGQSDLFLNNAHQMEVDINQVNKLVLSHGHFDHGNGLQYLSDKDLYCHPGAFIPRYSGKKKRYVGLNITEEQAKAGFNLTTSKEACRVTDKIWFLGEIPLKMSFEKSSKRFYTQDGDKDLLSDDSGIAITTPEGLFVISGCAHSGIINIIKHAQEITGITEVYGVMGGFHLLRNDHRTKETVKYLKEINPKVVLPAHCTALPALSAIYQAFDTQQVKAGNLYTFFTD